MDKKTFEKKWSEAEITYRKRSVEFWEKVEQYMEKLEKNQDYLLREYILSNIKGLEDEQFWIIESEDEIYLTKDADSREEVFFSLWDKNSPYSPTYIIEVLIRELLMYQKKFSKEE